MAKVGTLLNINGGGRKEKVEKKENGQGERGGRRKEEGEEGQDTRNSLAGGMKADLLWQEF